jgi:hypothetical protein
MPIGYTDEKDEVWCDGCVLKDKHLVERIKANMEAAYKQGIKDALNSIKAEVYDFEKKVEKGYF